MGSLQKNVRDCGINFSKIISNTHISATLYFWSVLKFLKSFITSRKFYKSLDWSKKGRKFSPTCADFCLLQQKYVGKTHSLSSSQGAEWRHWRDWRRNRSGVAVKFYPIVFATEVCIWCYLACCCFLVCIKPCAQRKANYSFAFY